MKNALFGALGAAGLAAGLLVGAASSPAADHLESPVVAQDGRTDINDLYVFQSPDDASKTVLIMTVNPAAGILSDTTLSPDAKYRLMIDTNGNGRKNDRIELEFGEVVDGVQKYTVRGAVTRGEGQTGQEVELGENSRAYVGTFDDPFFFDFQAFQDQVKGQGGSRTFCDGHEVDFFAGFDTTAIVLEVPTENLTKGSPNIGVWAETWGTDGQIDRMGRPGINTVLIDDGSEQRFNTTRVQRTNARFGNQVVDNLLFLSGLDGSGYTEAEATGIKDLLLPDTLTYDTSAPAGYLNGRALEDDVIDTSLFVVTGGLGANGSAVLDSDCVDGNDAAFPGTFPYLAAANAPQ